MSEHPQPIVELVKHLIESLQKNSLFILQSVKNGAVSADDLKIMNFYSQQISESFDFIAKSYINGNVTAKFTMDLIAKIIQIEGAEHKSNDGIKGVAILLSSTMDQLCCEENITIPLTNLLNRLQKIVIPSDCYSLPVKKKIHDVLSMAKHRFGYEIEEMKDSNESSSMESIDLSELRQMHQNIFEKNRKN